MVLNDPVANVMSNILNAEKIGKKKIRVKPSSKIIVKILEIMKDNHYVGEFNEVKTNRGNYVVINLINNINKCGVIKPKFSVKNTEYEKFEKRFLIAKDFGILVVSTTQGFMTHKQAKKKGLGGRLFAYCY
ncbi:MAG: 30S ribosomal protein S8 [Candidatus Woesearchaeota archaeon]|nr:30S ribosomal protein S8 [Candidatus Woesearchaeota archaeon]